MDTAGDDDRWQRVAHAARARLIEMRVWGNLTEIARQSGVSDATWRNLLTGQPIKREDRLILICDYLGWTVDSVDRILDGGAPQPAHPPPAAGVSDLELRREFEQMRRDLDEARQEWKDAMERIEHQLDPRPLPRSRGRRAGGNGER